jgi:hypothetical protein
MIFIEFAAKHYAVFLVAVFSFFACGDCFFRSLSLKTTNDAITRFILKITFGQGFFIIYLQILGIYGLLRTLWIDTFILFFIILWLTLFFIGQVQQLSPRSLSRVKASLINFCHSMSSNVWLSLALIFIFSLPALIAPLRVPLPGDEVGHHLPHAVQWAQSGYLSVNEWLRYPWFPFNYNLLFASGLLIYDDLLTHMFNTSAGLMVAVLTYRLSVRFFSQPVAVVAILIWLQLDRGDFGKANVDMGLTLYILCSLIVLYEWIYTDRSKRLLFMASFFLGIAIGTKYQALMFLPLIGVVIIFLEPRPSYLLISAFGLLVPCGYWYIRNYLITGDPFDPFGAKIFGFYDWNAQDYAAQFKDLQHQAGWPRLEFGRHC